MAGSKAVKHEVITVYASVGNSDDKLSQSCWSSYVRQFVINIRRHAEQVHGEWYSAPDTPFQNACVCFEISGDDRIEHLKMVLGDLADRNNQDSIAWAIAETEFISGRSGDQP
jgi:hypothetical protein